MNSIYMKQTPRTRQQANRLLKKWSGEHRNCQDNETSARESWERMSADFGLPDASQTFSAEVWLFAGTAQPIVLSAALDFYHGWSVTALNC